MAMYLWIGWARNWICSILNSMPNISMNGGLLPGEMNQYARMFGGDYTDDGFYTGAWSDIEQTYGGLRNRLAR